ncbi:MAG TPA: RagB/SusD family nutrient uptake outer membrane protein, partial [Ohtaekwangia sp.]
MKIITNKTSIVAALTTVLLLTSCLGDLDTRPIDDKVYTSNVVYTTKESYKAGLAKLYAAFALTGQQGPFGNQDVKGVDEGLSDFIRSMWYMNELTTDEAVWTYSGDAQNTIFNMHYNSWTKTDPILSAMFARIVYVAAICNEFIRVTASKTDDPDFKKFHAEARFLRALSYYYGVDLFDKVAFITEADLPGAFFPPQKKRADLFDYVESELLAIKADLGEPRFEYGRADKAACAMLLAKLYLNAEVYTGEARYTDAITQLNEVIAAGYSLSPKYLNNFLADNHTSPEIIFAQLFDGQRSQAYDAVNIMIFGNSGNGGWNGLRTTSAFVDKFSDSPNEARALFAKEDKGQSLE